MTTSKSAQYMVKPTHAERIENLETLFVDCLEVLVEVLKITNKITGNGRDNMRIEKLEKTVKECAKARQRRRF